MSPHCLEARKIRAELSRRFPWASPDQIKRAWTAFAYGATAKQVARILSPIERKIP